MRALVLSVALGVVALMESCAAFSDAPSEGTDGGAAEGGAASLDGSASVDGATVEGCPNGGTRFEDAFTQRPNVQGDWADILEENGTLTIEQDSLRVLAQPAIVGAPKKKTILYFKAPSPVKRACASFRMIVSEPAGFGTSGYDATGRTLFAYFAAEQPEEEFYHGVTLSAAGLRAYFTVSFGTADDSRRVTPAGAEFRVVIDVDYVSGVSRIGVDGQEHTFANSYQPNLGLPTPFLSLGAQQAGQAPRVDVRYDDVVIVMYP